MTAAFQVPWETPTAPVATPEVPDETPPQKRRGRRRAAPIQGAGEGACLWLYHHLTISGPAEGLHSFAAAARGAGVTPWRLDGSHIEEEVFHQAISQPASRRNLTVEGCRILARQFRNRVEAHQARATKHAREGAALVARSLACPFDLHALLPVPEAILQRGPTDPAALAWLTQHWGVTNRLRQITLRDKPTMGRRLPRGHAVIGYGFFTAGETPHPATAQLGVRWPALRFQLVPRPAF